MVTRVFVLVLESMVPNCIYSALILQRKILAVSQLLIIGLLKEKLNSKKDFFHKNCTVPYYTVLVLSLSPLFYEEIKGN